MLAVEFLDRVFAQLPGLKRGEGFTHTTWKYGKRPTSEGLGRMPVAVDVDAMVSRILDVESYPGNIAYVDRVEVLSRPSDSEVVYVQRLSLPVLGKMQMALRLADLGEREGYRLIAWEQDDDATDALDKKQGMRTQYNLGAWLLRPDEVLYALASAPRRSDVSALKYAAMTAGAEVTAGEALRGNIEGMVAWSKR